MTFPHWKSNSHQRRRCLEFRTCCSPFTIYSVLPTDYDLFPTAYCLLPTAYSPHQIGSPRQPSDLVRILVAAAGEADDQNLAGSETAGFLERLGHGVARLERGQDAFVPGGDVVGVEGLGVGDALVADAAEVFPVAVLGPDARIIQARRDRVDVLRSGRRRLGRRS